MRLRLPFRRKAKLQPEPASSKSPYGLKTLYESGDPVVEQVAFFIYHFVVFVHGLTGHREKTWTARGADKPWPGVLLQKELPESRIMTFGYDADVVDWRALVSKNKIDNHAKNLLAALAHIRDDDKAATRPIIFVAHSLGGLISEDALVWSKDSAEKHLQKIAECTRGILFLGTPHSGSGFAVAAGALARYLNLVKQTNTQILNALRTDSEVLARIQAAFQNMIRARANDPNLSINITCFYEELPLAVVGEVVPMRSAILPAYASIGIHGNHMDMTKFQDEDDPGFVSVAGELRRWVKELSAAKIAVNSPEQEGHVQAGPQTPMSRTPPAVTHNGNNQGQARAVYGGSMYNMAPAETVPG
ncbi:Alpha/Beta hydrolase protein [Annulohypoxylon moriforme]|nr:Alpha/Beta hydrolase protein [Annulohypoxylon moriforme]